MALLQTAKEEVDAALAHLKTELASIRTGRANPMLVEDISVVAYDMKQPMKNVATITTPDPKTIMIAPWDKGVLGEIEKAITSAKIGLNPVNDGNVVRVPIPALTEETRKELVKTVKQRLENVRIRIRKSRDDVRGKISAQEKSGEITEDQKFADQAKLDDIVKEANATIETMGKEKEKEIMTV